MFDSAEAATIYREIEASESYRNTRMELWEDLVGSYTGPAYNSGAPDDTENHNFAYVTWILDQLVHNQPRFAISSRAGEEANDAVAALEHALNRWTRDVDLQETMRRIVQDMLFAWGVALVGVEDHPYMDEKSTKEVNEKLRDGQDREGPVEQPMVDPIEAPSWPFVRRLSPSDFGIDPAAKSFDTAAYMWHKEVWDKDELIAYAEARPKEGWLVDDIKGMPTTDDAKALGREGKGVPRRNEVVIYCVWERRGKAPKVPWASDEEPTAEFGYHGVIHTLAHVPAAGHQGSGWNGMIREPVPAYCPPTGPYVMGGCFDVPDEVWPLAPLVAVKPQVDRLNAIDDSLQISAESYKKMVGYQRGNEQDAEALQVGRHEFFVGLNMLSEKLPPTVPIEIGGISDQQLAWREYTRKQLMDISGFDEQQRGVAASSSTATAAAIADSNSDIRTGAVKKRANRLATEIAKAVTWYMHQDKSVVIRLDQDSPWEWYAAERDGGIPYAALEVVIEAGSMDRTNPQTMQLRAMEAHQMVGATLPLMVQFAFYDWRAHFEGLADQLNQPQLAHRFNWDQLKEMQALVLGMQLKAADQPTEGQKRPRLGGMDTPGSAAQAPQAPAPPPQMAPQFGGMPMPGALGAGAAQGAGVQPGGLGGPLG